MNTKIIILGLLASTTMAGAALAQGVAQGPQSPADVAGENSATSGFGDIVVTAQRRSESLQRTPVSVAVLTSEKLAKQQTATESDLQLATPGLIVRAGQNSKDRKSTRLYSSH